MKTIKYLYLTLKAFALSDSPLFFPWWMVILYFSVWSSSMTLVHMIFTNAFKL